jgi:hypothetical protein
MLFNDRSLRAPARAPQGAGAAHLVALARFAPLGLLSGERTPHYFAAGVGARA